MKRICKTIRGRHGKLYIVVDGNRYQLARCRPEIELVEDVVEIPALGCGRFIKKRLVTMLLTFDHRMESVLDIEEATGFDFQGDFLRKDGALECIQFSHCLLASDLDLTDGGTCTFEVECSPAMMKKLLEM